MSREKLKEYLSTNKDKLVRISCHSAGVIVMCVQGGRFEVPGRFRRITAEID